MAGTLDISARERRDCAVLLAADFGGVLSRRHLRALGVGRKAVAREVDAGRWRVHGHQTVAVHTSVLSVDGQCWRAIWEVGEGIAALDGVSALNAAGLVGFEVPAIQVSVPHGSTPYRVDGVRWRSVVRGEGEVVGAAGLHRVRVPIAAVRAAHWAVSDRQAALVLAMSVQQRLVTCDQLRQAVRSCRTRGRVELIRDLVEAIAGGAQTLGELDFARRCRVRGLPEPDRQVIVRTSTGRIYLDVRWSDIGLVVEIDGSGHRVGLAVTDDNLRQNSVWLEGDVVLRIDVVGLRVRGEEFMDQVCAAHGVLTARARSRLAGTVR